jgi:hypothetical protein
MAMAKERVTVVFWWWWGHREVDAGAAQALVLEALKSGAVTGWRREAESGSGDGAERWSRVGERWWGSAAKPSQGAAMAEERVMDALRWWQSSSDGDGDGGASKNFDSLPASLQNPLISRVFNTGIMFYIWRPSLVSVILMWPTQKISIIGISCLYIADTYVYWYRLY